METDLAPVEAFLDSINDAWRTRDLELLRRAMGPGDEVVFIGTDASELIVGGSAFVQVAAEQLAAVKKVDMRVSQRWIQRRGDVAWFSALLELHFHIGEESTEIPGVRQSGVVELRDGRWTMVQGHMSIGVRVPSP